MTALIRSRRGWRALLKARFDMTPEESPCTWPVAKVRAAVAGEFRLFRDAPMRVIRRGHNLVVESAGEWIFKFPWHPKADLRQELAVLKLLRGRLAIPIPEPVFVARGGRFFGYRKIPGRTLRRADVRHMGSAARTVLASALAGLCEDVQRAVPPESRRALLGPRPAMPSRAVVAAAARTFREVFGRDRGLVRLADRVFAAFTVRCAAVSAADADRVSFDLQFDNLLVDRARRLTGAVDFGYLQWACGADLFGLLYKDDPGLARLAMRDWERRTGERVNVRHAAAQGYWQVFTYLVEVATNRWDMASRRREFLALARRAALP